MELVFKNMYTNIYYLYLLIDRSMSFKNDEKIKIFNYAKSNKIETVKMIRIFEDEQK
jgi:hypothetical protein